MAVADLMENQGSVTTGKVMKLLGVTDRGAQLLMRRLIEKSVSEKVGAGHSTRYRLKARKEGA